MSDQIIYKKIAAMILSVIVFTGFCFVKKCLDKQINSNANLFRAQSKWVGHSNIASTTRNGELPSSDRLSNALFRRLMV